MPFLSLHRTERETSRYQAYNVGDGFTPTENIAEYFSLTARPETKISRGVRDEFSAPMLLTRPRPVQKFQVLEVTVSSSFVEDNDQAGIVLFFDMTPDQPWNSPASTNDQQREIGHLHPIRQQQHTGRWVTAALQQIEEGQMGLVTVVARPGCEQDQSTSYLPIDLPGRYGFQSGQSTLRIKVERVGDKLWVSYRLELLLSRPHEAYRSPEDVNQTWRPAREVDGFFSDMTAKQPLMVGCYASRPHPRRESDDDDDHHRDDSSGSLVAQFEDLALLESP